jgi:hypothetical protein
MSRREYRTHKSLGLTLVVDHMWCLECLQSKLISDFRVLASGSRESYCRDCHNARGRAWRAENGEAFNARRRAAYRKRIFARDMNSHEDPTDD